MRHPHDLIGRFRVADEGRCGGMHALLRGSLGRSLLELPEFGELVEVLVVDPRGMRSDHLLAAPVILK